MANALHGDPLFNASSLSATGPRLTSLVAGGRTFEWGSRTYVIGVLNLTPDSFSGDGLSYDIEAAVAQGMRFEEEGADIVDIGGESTRPASVYAGAAPVSAEEELKRVMPALERLVARLKVPVSIDTRKARVAHEAVRAGAAMVNDVSMLGDPEMARSVAELDAPIVISHTRQRAEYQDVVAEVLADLRSAVDRARAVGVKPGHIIVDPGIGFGKTVLQSLEMLRGVSALKALGYPVLIGTSRKSSIGAVLNLPANERVEGTAATVALAIQRGVDIVRVHDVKAMVRVARMSDAVVRGWRPPASPASPASSA